MHCIMEKKENCTQQLQDSNLSQGAWSEHTATQQGGGREHEKMPQTDRGGLVAVPAGLGAMCHTALGKQHLRLRALALLRQEQCD